MDFGTNPAPATTTRRAGKQAESHGIVTIELANGQRLDGYILLSEKNAGKLGVSKEKLAELVKAQAKATSKATLHVSFGDRETAVAEECVLDFG